MRCLLWWIMQSWSISWNYWRVPLTLCPAHWGISIGPRTLVQKIIPATTTVHPHRGILIGSRTLYLLKLFKWRWLGVCTDWNSTILLTIIARFPVSGCVIVIQAATLEEALDSPILGVSAKYWCVYPWVWSVDRIADIADSAQTEYCSTFPLSVRVFVCHRRDISHFSHI